ncbi:DNA polymerase III subunit epsilon [Mesorhizobium sp. BR1-1-16]|uniref:DNA polymerase III subunit epsilon n=1 Tax=Mesorhizobium sp. BR1-1-16 TaxID=2876653 RepID=UPI001CCE0002|nr:DNA polymerase III subunit epsilon [Mesorhizobium sp. BR1-1-16]MBZ9938025.1 DNA polymerase III subunit epsilon [Mesorhizobium sp. BR1-1-16]
MREIVFDTETTGLDPLKGDRLVEIGCIELYNHLPTGRHYHVYINPERSMPDEAFRVHGLSAEFLADKPVFASVAEEFATFIGDAPLIAHNATFDIGFINAEFGRLGMPAVVSARVIDTLMLARKKHPNGPNSLDALCARYGVDTSKRTLHGGLLDAQLLADVYLELIGGRQPGLILVTEQEVAAAATVAAAGGVRPILVRPAPLPSRLTEADRAAHAALVGKLSGAIWTSYLEPAESPPA